ncbi:hypothetical protein TRFO_40663 [Tritrichomonas foetus]|uniref:Intimal thickness related receptor IRP domain-containing protein n=1 Tax=Tritrichomonas foetus TaxID=1144522 RepID=A0A1J4J2R2_9EUKA|nr:hypothetical protein TRFO_40663 [Tritrichomonas foetus]|eukprot:OHS93025.1 hypothetical protein TRFO_40663 [Tritrichomonas foetus]
MIRFLRIFSLLFSFFDIPVANHQSKLFDKTEKAPIKFKHINSNDIKLNIYYIKPDLTTFIKNTFSINLTIVCYDTSGKLIRGSEIFHNSHPQFLQNEDISYPEVISHQIFDESIYSIVISPELNTDNTPNLIFEIESPNPTLFEQRANLCIIFMIFVGFFVIRYIIVLKNITSIGKEYLFTFAFLLLLFIFDWSTMKNENANIRVGRFTKMQMQINTILNSLFRISFLVFLNFNNIYNASFFAILNLILFLLMSLDVFGIEFISDWVVGLFYFVISTTETFYIYYLNSKQVIRSKFKIYLVVYLIIASMIFISRIFSALSNETTFLSNAHEFGVIILIHCYAFTVAYMHYPTNNKSVMNYIVL